MTEAKFQTAFNKWLKHNWNATSVFELKVEKGKSMPFSVVKEHQIHGLKMARGKIVFKIPDSDNAPKPFDCFSIMDAPGYVVIMYYTRGERKFYMIEVSRFEKEKNNSNRKSLTKERAAEIANFIGILKTL